MKNGVRIHNPLLHEVRNSFSSIYQATWATSILFDQYYSVTITEDEIAYIALYLGVEMCIRDSFRGVIFWILLFMLIYLIYLPFFKVYENQEMKKEAAEEGKETV